MGVRVSLPLIIIYSFFMIFNELYLFILWFICSFFLVMILFFVSFVFSFKNKEEEKLTAYECGFDPFDSGRIKFDIHFFIIAILFLLFDLEILYFFPFSVNLYNFSNFSFICFLLFFWIILLGFVYEWKKGALTWIK